MNEFTVKEVATLHRLVCDVLIHASPEDEKANPGELEHLEQLADKLRKMLKPPTK